MPYWEKLWEMHFADWISLVPAVIAIYAVFSAWRARPISLLVRRRHSAMKALDIPKKSSKSRVKDIIHGAPCTAADEIHWLSTIQPTHRIGSGGDISAQSLISYSAGSSRLIALSRAYRKYAADLRRGSILGTSSIPVVIQEATMASLTANLLAEAAAGHARKGSFGPLTIETPAMRRTLEFFELPDASRGTLAFDLFVSYRRHRILPRLQNHHVSPLENPGVEEHFMQATQEELLGLQTKLSSQHSFDGVLPRLAGWRTERDESNGRLRIHLALSETTYGAVILDHYPAELLDGRSGNRSVTGARTNLLTLSAGVVTQDRVLLFAGRSKNAGSHQDQFGPAVNGNLELRTRKGIFPDGDDLGLPDPRKALAREAAEELGLQLMPEAIHALGLGRFSVADKERGTHVLMALAQVPQNVEQVVSGVRDADPLEGRWEVGGHLLAAPLPTNDHEVDSMLSWLFHDERLTPHAVLVGCATLARFFPIDADRLRGAATSGSRCSWGTTVLPLNS